ncbi:MAG: hypothetical protein GY697_08090, partial [Desulfobacterales bacterium]|nr:hypothetical protein [Desulfobacterales bacterium]
MVNDLLAGIALVEVSALTLALFALFRQWENTLAEAGAYAIVTCMMVFSFLFQSGFMPGLRYPSLVAEILVLITGARFIIQRRKNLAIDLRSFLGFARVYRVAFAAISVVLCYLATWAILVPPAAYHWNQLMPVLYCQLNNGFPLTAPTAEQILPLYPINTGALAHLVLRFNTDTGLGIFGFLAYLSIGFSTYSLSRRYAWPPTAFTAVIIVLSMPRFIYQATSPGGEIVPAASALFCILALYRVIEVPNIRDLFVLMAGIFFTLTEDATCFILPSIFIILAGILMFRRHGARVWWQIILRNKIAAGAVVVPVMVFSQAWLFARNIIKGEDWVGAPDFTAFAYNNDGIQGAFANLVRYLFQSVDLTRPADLLWQFLSGIPFTDLLLKLYAVTAAPLFGNLGATVPFTLSSIPDEMFAWFGPAGFLLVLPAFGYAAIRGPRRLKATAIALGIYLYTLCLIVAWNPTNVRYFSIFFACTGFFTAFFLPPWRLTTTGK